MKEIRTNKSVQEIMDEIRRKKEKKESILLTPDSIEYSKFHIEKDKIIINRNPHIFLPFRGIGQITMEFTGDNNDTIIRCKIDAFRLESFIWSAILGFVFLLISLPFVFIQNFIIVIFLLLAYLIIFLIIYLSTKFNTYKLQESLEYIISDLKLI